MARLGRLLWGLLALSIGGVAASQIGAAPMGNALVYTADVLERGVAFLDTTCLGGSEPERWLNTQFGAGRRLDCGLDVSLKPSGRAVFNVRWCANPDPKRLVSVGLQNIGGGRVESYVVGTLSLRERLRLNWGAIFSRRTAPFLGLDFDLSERVMLHVEWMGGDEPARAVGVEVSFGGGYAALVSAVRQGGEWRPFLDLIWTGSVR